MASKRMLIVDMKGMRLATGEFASLLDTESITIERDGLDDFCKKNPEIGREIANYCMSHNGPPPEIIIASTDDPVCFNNVSTAIQMRSRPGPEPEPEQGRVIQIGPQGILSQLQQVQQIMHSPDTPQMLLTGEKPKSKRSKKVYDKIPQKAYRRHGDR